MEQEIRSAIEKNVRVAIDKLLHDEIEKRLPEIAASMTVELMRYVQVQRKGNVYEVSYSISTSPDSTNRI